MRLIDADAMFDENHCYTTFNKNLDYCDDNDLGEWIDEQPTVDAEPVRHGEWIHDINNLYGCSECFNRETMSLKRLKPYCPNCGAKMDGGSKRD